MQVERILDHRSAPELKADLQKHEDHWLCFVRPPIAKFAAQANLPENSRLTVENAVICNQPWRLVHAWSNLDYRL